MTGPARWQQCEDCGHRLDAHDPRTACPACGGLLDISLDLSGWTAAGLRTAFAQRASSIGPAEGVSGVWRYRELVLDAAAGSIVSFPEGNTPLVASTALAAWSGCEGLDVKHEGMNPTGSFKDRGMTVGITQARLVGARAVACASTGNTSASLAAYAAVAGLPAIVLVPAGNIAIGKLTQTLSYGGKTLAVRGDFDACLSLAREAADRLGIYLLNSVNPYRVEGQKTIVFELLQQLDWTPPDWIALPAGNLGNLSACGKAIEQAKALGLIGRAPRLLAVQAAGAAPFHAASLEGFASRRRVTASTVATAIRIGDPASWSRGVRAIRSTRGQVVAVSDEELMDAQAAVGRAGIGCEPASAASVAGVRKAVRDGLIAPTDRVTCILTGHVLKDPGALLSYHIESDPPPPLRNAPVEIEATIGAVEAELRRLEGPSRHGGGEFRPEQVGRNVLS